MLMNKNILVIIPTYNRTDYLKEAIESVLTQTYECIDILVSDNGTDNSTKNMIECLFKDNVTYIKAGNGMSPLKHALCWEYYIQEYNCEYFTVFHDDDVMERNHIDVAISLLDKHKNISAVSASTTLIDSSSEKIGSKSFFKIFQDREIKGYWGVLLTCWLNPLIYPSVVYRKIDNYNPAELFADEALGYFDYANSILTIYNEGVIISGLKTLKYRLHNGQDSNNFLKNHWKLHIKARNIGIKKINSNTLSKQFLYLFFYILDNSYYIYKYFKKKLL